MKIDGQQHRFCVVFDYKHRIYSLIDINRCAHTVYDPPELKEVLDA